MHNLIQSLAAALKRRGIKQTDLAREIGLTQQGVSAILHGKSNPSLSVFVKMCEAVGIEITLSNLPSDGGKNLGTMKSKVFCLDYDWNNCCITVGNPEAQLAFEELHKGAHVVHDERKSVAYFGESGVETATRLQGEYTLKNFKFQLA